MDLFSISSREGRLTLSLSDCHKLSVLFLVWSSPFDRLIAGANFLIFCVGFGLQALTICGVSQSGSFSGFGYFLARLLKEV